MATPRKVKLPAQLTAVEDLLLWHNVPKSAAVLGGATLLYLLLEWSKTPLLTWLCNGGLLLVAACVIWAALARFASLTGPAENMPSILRTGLDEETVRGFAERTRVFTNDMLALVKRIISGEDFILIGKTQAVLWIVGWMGRFITPVGLLYTAILGLFTLPKVYEMRKEEIDSAVGRARDVGVQQYTVARGKATELINRLTPQKGARPAASDLSKDD